MKYEKMTYGRAIDTIMEREQIIKALECCASEKYICEQCPIEQKIKDDCECGKVVARNALALIKELTEKIGDLECKVEEYRADAISWQATVDEISNGDKTLYDAINSLRRKSREYDELNLKAYNLNMEIKELTEENERLKSAEFTCGFIKPHKVLECPIFDEIAKTKADTVRKYREGLYRELASLGAKDKFNKELFLTKADQIAKEIMEGV